MEKEHLQRLETLLKKSRRYSELSPEDEIARHEQLANELERALNMQQISDCLDAEDAFELDGTAVAT